MTDVFLVDDHDVVRRGIRRVIESEPGFRVCGEASNGRDAVAMAIDLAPDVVVVDLGMPELNGLEAIRRIRRARPASMAVVYSMHLTDLLVREAIAAGANGYLMKSDGAAQLLDAVKSVSAHRPFFSPAVSATILDTLVRSPNELQQLRSSAVKLTSREREIVQLLSEGKSNREIASLLSISAKTVETHRSTVMRKLELDSFADLVRYALRSGIAYL